CHGRPGSVFLDGGEIGRAGSDQNRSAPDRAHCRRGHPAEGRSPRAAPPVGGTAWLADACGAPVPASLNEGAVTVIIGPEGGLTSTERDTVVGAGYQLVSLGLHTLRFETAAVAAAAAVTHARMRSARG